MLNNALTLNPFTTAKVKSVELIQNAETNEVDTFPYIKICPDCPDTDPVTIQLRNWYGVEVRLSVVDGKAVVENPYGKMSTKRPTEVAPRYTLPKSFVKIWKLGLNL